MQNCQCPNCGKSTEVTVDTVKRRWVARGYKFEGWIYYVYCSNCHMAKELNWRDLPFKVKWNFLFNKKR